ncbi:MAG: hypothetical protein ACI4VG_06450 [Lachnospiraceae bacterium]
MILFFCHFFKINLRRKKAKNHFSVAFKNRKMEGVWGCAPTSKMSENLQCKFSANGVSGYPLALLAILPNTPIWKSVLIRIGGFVQNTFGRFRP